MLPVYRKFRKNKGKVTPKTRNRERYHRYRALNKVPTRYTSYAQLSDEEKTRLKTSVTASRMAKYHSNLSYKKLVNKQRALASLRARQLERLDIAYCTVCDKEKALCDFETRSTKSKTPRYECKACRKERNRLYYLNNKDKHKTEGEWNVQLKRQRA